MSKKTSQERLPPFDKYSDRDPKDSASHGVVLEPTMKRDGQEDEDIEPDEMSKGYMAGPPPPVAPFPPAAWKLLLVG